MLYNKDKEYTLKYIDINGQQQELKYTPEKDMSVPEIITMLQNKDKNFYKLLKEVNNKKEADKMLKKENKQVKTESINFSASTFDELEEEVTELYKNDKIDDDMYETILDLIDVERSNTEEYINNRREVTNTDYKDEIGIEEDNVEALEKAIKEKLPELTTESKLVEDEEDNDIEDVETEETNTVEPEDTTETQENMEQAVQELEDITEEEKFGIDTIASTIDVLITDEQSAIDGYNSFLGQCKNTLPNELYNTIKTEIDEIIQDEEDHINKLTVIKETLNTDTAPSENIDTVELQDADTIEENKQLKENSSHTFKYKKGDTVPFKGKNYEVVKIIPAHQWEGQNTSEDEQDSNSFVEFTDDMYEIQNPEDSTDWGYVKATELEK